MKSPIRDEDVESNVIPYKRILPWVPLSPREVAKKPIRGGVVEFNINSYNGEILEGRVLLGATDEPFVLDGRLNEQSDVDLENIRACDNRDQLNRVILCLVGPPARADQMITVRQGYWYGGPVRLWIFDEEETGIGPECLEAELIARTIDGRIVAKMPIRVVRTDKPPVSTDGGTEAPKAPASDAGAP